MKREKDEIIKREKQLKQYEFKMKKEEFKNEIKIQKERKLDIKKFIRDYFLKH